MQKVTTLVWRKEGGRVYASIADQDRAGGFCNPGMIMNALHCP